MRKVTRISIKELQEYLNDNHTTTEIQHTKINFTINSDDYFNTIKNSVSSSKYQTILLMINANGSKPGGYEYKKYSNSIMNIGQEEKCCINSNLMEYFPYIKYPINPLEELFICNNVKFNLYKDNSTTCDVALCVAPLHQLNCITNSNGVAYDKMTSNEINQINIQIQLFYYASLLYKYDLTICSALGLISS